MGFALLLILWLRARRYGTDFFPSFAGLWLCISIGFAVYSVVERHYAIADIALGIVSAAALPLAAAWLIRRWMKRKRS